MPDHRVMHGRERIRTADCRIIPFAGDADPLLSGYLRTVAQIGLAIVAMTIVRF